MTGWKTIPQIVRSVLSRIDVTDNSVVVMEERGENAQRWIQNASPDLPTTIGGTPVVNSSLELQP